VGREDRRGAQRFWRSRVCSQEVPSGRVWAVGRGHAPLAKRGEAYTPFDGLPTPFDEINTPDIPVDILPGALGEFASALSTATETPPALAVMAALTAVATAVTKKYVVSPQRLDWREPMNIYIITALPPANNKSLVLNECRRP